MQYTFDFAYLMKNGEPINPLAYVDFIPFNSDKPFTKLDLVEGKDYILDYENGILKLTLKEEDYKDLYGQCIVYFKHPMEGYESSYTCESFMVLVPKYMVKVKESKDFIDDIAELVKNTYSAEEITNDDYYLPKYLSYESFTYNIDWKLEVLSGNKDSVKINHESIEGFITVDITDDQVKEDIVYILTAVISDESGNEIIETFTKNVPADSFTTHEEYLTSPDDTLITVEGYIIGVYPLVNGRTNLYIQTAAGEGYYVYRINVTEEQYNADFTLGNWIIVEGRKDTYLGTCEIVNATYKLSTKEDVTFEPYDITNLFVSASSISDQTLLDLQGSLVTIKGVTLATSDINGRMFFTRNGKETYLRISSSGNCSDYDPEAADIIKSKFQDNSGKLAQITGIATVYNGEFYIIPTSRDSIKIME